MIMSKNGGLRHRGKSLNVHKEVLASSKTWEKAFELPIKEVKEKSYEVFFELEKALVTPPAAATLHGAASDADSPARPPHHHTSWPRPALRLWWCCS
ncbi:hypothetical protein PG984_011076 [Apiospora sp. TS-2023a]